MRPRRGKKVAVIGAGPAGLTAALRLAQRGYDVTVHEALPVAGGMMAVGIPDYRLPKDVLRARSSTSNALASRSSSTRALGRDFTLDDLTGRDGYHAVVLAIGAQQGPALGVPGEEREGVMGLPPSFLKRCRPRQSPRI
jgi:NADH-quinone oxidoreductase subunit F